MSAERFFDDLARTLAEPMPRRRAVRVLGVTLAAVAVPGFRPREAGAVTSGRSVTCGRDRRTCQKGAEANFAEYCCPAPSWRWLCGSQTNGYACINTCRGRTAFPCTALIAHPESGINGVCCDRKLHVGCARIGPPAERRPDGSVVPSEEWKPSCCPKGFGFCGGVCCQPPNRCRNGRCRCPNGTASCDGRGCCKRGETCKDCYEFGPYTENPRRVDFQVVGRKCCPDNGGTCCGKTCCNAAGCCGGKCCPLNTSVCAHAGDGRLACCPRERVTGAFDNPNGERFCCPSGTFAGPFGCCPQSAPFCCGDGSAPSVKCGKKICVRGTCVAP